MSQIIAPKYTEVYNIPLSRRIAEIMKEKGDAFSQTVVSRHLKISRETLRLKLKGCSEIYNYELDKIVKFLKVPVVRIMMIDIRDDVHFLEEHKSSEEHKQASLEIAKKLYQVAIGVTEKCIAAHQVGLSYKNLNQYDEAHKVWEEAYGYAQQIQNKFGETDLLYTILRNLITTYTHRNDLTKAIELIQVFEPQLESTPLRSASLAYSRAKIYEHLGNIDSARNVSQLSLEYCQKSGNTNSVAKAKINIAHYEYKLKNYTLSKQMLQEAIVDLENDTVTQLIAMKDLCKTVIQLGEVDLGLEIIENALEKIDALNENSNHHMKGRFLILKARALKQPFDAEFVLYEEYYEKGVRHTACKYLINYYKEMGDEVQFMKYSKMETELFIEQSDILEGDDL